MLINRFSALGDIAGMNPVLRIMGMTYHQMSFMKFSQQLEHLCIVLVFIDRCSATFCASPERDVRAEEDHLVLLVLHECQISPQPFKLLC